MGNLQITKKDKILMLGVLLLVGLLAYMFYGKQQAGKMVSIQIDGKHYKNYLIEENQTIEIDTEYGHNKLVIENGEVSMLEADCPDQYCVAHRAIRNQRETIVCLPHRLVIELIGESKKQIDAEINMEIDGITQ